MSEDLNFSKVSLEHAIFMKLPFESVKRKYLKDLDIIEEIPLSYDDKYVFIGKQGTISNEVWKKLATRAFLAKVEEEEYSLILITMVYGVLNQYETTTFGSWKSVNSFRKWMKGTGQK